MSVFIMSLKGGIIWCVALLYKPGKTGRGLTYEETFRRILSSPQKHHH